MGYNFTVNAMKYVEVASINLSYDVYGLAKDLKIYDLIFNRPARCNSVVDGVRLAVDDLSSSKMHYSEKYNIETVQSMLRFLRTLYAICIENPEGYIEVFK